MVKEIKKVYGPYLASSGRRFVVLTFNDGTRRSQFYSRFLWEQKNGKIPEGLEVDHVDETGLNDSVDNFQLLTPEENKAKYAALRVKPAELFEGMCSECGASFSKLLRDVKHNNRSQGKAGPFCSKSCAGKYSKKIQIALKSV